MNRLVCALKVACELRDHYKRSFDDLKEATEDLVRRNSALKKGISGLEGERAQLDRSFQAEVHALTIKLDEADKAFEVIREKIMGEK